jgi:catechol 2,3-dioxygenase-like lactoylglutathione lyase family enzyme
MPLGGLQHYTIEPSDLERTKDFYCEVLGLENGDRPPLDFPGYWLYSGGTATVHLMGTRKAREGIVVRGTEKKYEDTGGSITSPLPRPTSRVCANACNPRT